MPKVSEMNAGERKELMTKIADQLKANGLEDAELTFSRETVCPIAAKTVQDTVTIEVSGKFPFDKSEAVEAFKTWAKSQEVDGFQYTLGCQLKQGDPYKTITGVTTIADASKTVEIVHKEGEVMLLDFWATWCPPCQKPMAHNEEMLKKRGADWNGKVRIIGISIDKEATAVVKHCDDKGWNSPEHYHRAGSQAFQEYGGNGVPHVVLVDTKGTVVFIGHPAARPNLEQDFDDLLAGKTLETKEAGGGCCDAQGNCSKTDGATVDVEAANAQIDTFKNETAPALYGQHGDTCKTMPRAFCVMVLQDKMNVATGESTLKFDNFRVLVGSQENIDKVLGWMNSNITGDFKVSERTQAV